MQQYRIVTDDDGHTFVIPAEKLEEWDAFVDDPEPSGWRAPEFAKPLAYPLHNYVFTSIVEAR